MWLGNSKTTVGTHKKMWLILLLGLVASTSGLKCHSSLADEGGECLHACARYSYFGTQFSGCLQVNSSTGASSMCDTVRFLDPDNACCCTTDYCNLYANCQVPSLSPSLGLVALGLALAAVAVWTIRRFSAAGLPPPLQQQLSSSRLKEESPAPPSSPKALAPQRRRSRASSDLSGFELPLPPPLPTAGNEGEDAPSSARATTKYLSMLVNGLASPFISNNSKSLRRNPTNEPATAATAASPQHPQPHALDIPKLRFVGNEFDEVLDMV